MQRKYGVNTAQISPFYLLYTTHIGYNKSITETHTTPQKEVNPQ